jgi:predicted  nucleic acid-binding Zn-ribbon protein
VTCIQTLTANLISSLQFEEDERISIAYLMLLLEWLYEDAAAVNDFLGEASSLQSLVQATLTPGEDRVIIRGLCAALLGVVYEFSTRDSPVPRRELQPVLMSKLGREKYLDAISKLRQHPLVRDFEVLPRTGGGNGSLPEVYFDEMFIDFLKDNFSRLTRAIDRDPNIEQHQSHDGVDRDVVDALRGERDEKEQTIQELKTQLMTLEQKLDQEFADHRKTQQSADEQRNTLKKINDKLHAELDKELASRDREHRQATLELENRYSVQVVALNSKLQQAAKESTLFISKTKQEYDEKLRVSNQGRTEAQSRLDASDKARHGALETIHGLEQTQRQTQIELTSVNESLRNLERYKEAGEAEVKKLRADKEELQSAIEKFRMESQELKTKVQDQTWKVKDAEEKLRKAEATAKGAKTGGEKDLKSLQEKLRAAEKSAEEKQTELDDLFVLLGDLEEKRTKDKVSLLFRGDMLRIKLTMCRNVSRNLGKKSLMARTKTRTMMKTKKKRMKMTSSTLFFYHTKQVGDPDVSMS